MERFESDMVRMEWMGDILRVTFKPGVIDGKDAREIVKDRLDFTSGQPCYMLVVDSGVTKISREARGYFASEEATETIKGGAFLVNRALTRIMVNFLLKVSKPNVPTKIFTNEKGALVWLKNMISAE